MPDDYVVKYKSFADGGTAESLFARAAEFATRVGSNRVINISHSEDTNVGVVTVWYRAEAGSDDE